MPRQITIIMTETTSYCFELEFTVRDYECDMQGIVNNAVYQNYLEHTRHEFLKSRGLDFAEITRQGLNLVVIRIELDYLMPLKSGDRFVVRLNASQISRLRFGFQQDIYRLPDNKLMVRAVVTGSGVTASGKPSLPAPLLQQILG